MGSNKQKTMEAYMKVVFSYKRPDLLLSLLKELDGNIHVIDDGSMYSYTEHKKYCNYHRLKHKGKQFWWKNWNYAFKLCKKSDSEHFLFCPDDWASYDIQRIKWLQNQFKDNPYAFNIANHGVSQQWTPLKAWQTTIKDFDAFRVGFVDCCFSTNRSALEKLDWTMEPISQTRFRDPNISSGVGRQLSERFLKAGVPMLKPVKSLCKKHHVESKMNKQERKNNPRPLL